MTGRGQGAGTRVFGGARALPEAPGDSPWSQAQGLLMPLARPWTVAVRPLQA